MKNPYARKSSFPSVRDDHPEKQPGEIYLGNATIEGFIGSGWKTKRLGRTPLMTDGTPYTGGGIKPWFIQISEVEEAIADAIASNDLTGKADSLQRMLYKEEPTP